MPRTLKAYVTGWHIRPVYVDKCTIRSVSVVAAVLLLIAACQNGKDGDVDSALAQLRQRPSIEQTVRTYQEMIGRMQRELDAAFGPHTWQVRGNIGGAGCTDFPNAGARRAASPTVTLGATCPTPTGHGRSRSSPRLAGNTGSAIRLQW